MVEDLHVVCKVALDVVRVEGALWLHGWHTIPLSWRLDYPILYMHARLELVWLGWEHPMMITLPCVRLRGKPFATSS